MSHRVDALWLISVVVDVYWILSVFVIISNVRT